MGLPKIKTSSEFRESLSETINEVNNGIEHLISHKSGNVILISETNYAKMLKELEDLKKITTGIFEIETGLGISHTKARVKLQSLKKKWS
jgi:PHD/YefM family antitoxin component YafN of YafNO toxin-antitoxin module